MDFFAGSLRRWLLVFAARVLRERRFFSFFTIRSAHEMNAGVVIVGWGEELYEQGKSRTAPQSQLTTKPTSMEEEGEQGFNGQGKKLFYLLCPLHHSFSPSFSFYLKNLLIVSSDENSIRAGVSCSDKFTLKISFCSGKLWRLLDFQDFQIAF